MVHIQEPEYEEHVPPFSETLKLGEIANEYDSHEMQVHQQLHDFTMHSLKRCKPSKSRRHLPRHQAIINGGTSQTHKLYLMICTNGGLVETVYYWM